MNPMVKLQPTRDEAALDGVFAALAHPARRATLDALGQGARTVSDLASPHGMSLAGFLKHVRVLESAGLVACVKEGRTVTCALVPRPLQDVSGWLARRERLWNARLDALGRHLYHQAQVAPARKARR